MPVQEKFGMQKNEAANRAVFPEGIYQAILKDIEVRDTKKWQSEDMEATYFFKFVLLDGPENIRGQGINAFVKMSWFQGSKRANPSKLYNVIKAFWAHYYPKIDPAEVDAEKITSSVLNKLIGQQVLLVVKFNQDRTNNKITDFSPIKAVLEVPAEYKITEALGVDPATAESEKVAAERKEPSKTPVTDAALKAQADKPADSPVDDDEDDSDFSKDTPF